MVAASILVRVVFSIVSARFRSVCIFQIRQKILRAMQVAGRNRMIHDRQQESGLRRVAVPIHILVRQMCR